MHTENQLVIWRRLVPITPMKPLTRECDYNRVIEACDVSCRDSELMITRADF